MHEMQMQFRILVLNVLLRCYVGRLQGVFSELDALATLIAAAVHDVDHPGVTNQYLINTSTSSPSLFLPRAFLATIKSFHRTVVRRVSHSDIHTERKCAENYTKWHKKISFLNCYYLFCNFKP